MDNYEKARHTVTYSNLEMEFERLKQQRKFGTDAAKGGSDLRQFKIAIGEKLYKSVAIANRCEKIMFVIGAICVVLSIIACIAAGGNIMGAVFIFLGAPFFLVCNFVRKAFEKKSDAYVAFDKDYFDGEIVFKRKNGIAL